ncbi:FERM domain-containing protein 6 isoform X4 [Gadus chalcogrammus]|uniref:FERM domain-containing protein 6 isoform X4 n=1 Tax=Gadus chalcogrammus TaxID=1042646 RepID=UPI0024C4BB5B|nr:FERM domain-containing protein 6 isoform X4 [Gadus chalcogrammus]
MRKRQVRRVCVVLSNKQRLDCIVRVSPIRVSSIGRQVLDHVTLMCGVRSLQIFGLAIFLEHEYLFVDLDQNLGKYFGKEWRRTSTKEVLFLQLAAAALQAEMGDAEEQILGDGDEQNGKENTIVSEKKQNQNYFLPEDYFPSWLIRHRGRDFLLRHAGALHATLRGLARPRAIRRFIEDASALQDVPVTVYTLRQDKRDVRGCVHLAVTLKGLCVHQEVEGKLHLLYDCTWKEIHSLTFRGKRFEVQTGGRLGVVSLMVYYTASPCHSRLLLRHLQQTHRYQLDNRRTQRPDTGARVGQLYREASICDLAWLGERLRCASSSSLTTYISEYNSDHTTPKPSPLPRDRAGRPPVIAEVEMSVDDPPEILVDGDRELLVDDPTQVPWLADGLCVSWVWSGHQ